MDIQCFWLEETGGVARSLRRFASRISGRTIEQVDSKRYECPLPMGYHNAQVAIEPMAWPPRTTLDVTSYTNPREFAGDQRWPKHCACGYEFAQDDQWQIFTERLMRRTDTGEILSLRDAPPGAMWDAWWLESMKTTQVRPNDGISLMVATPDGEWFVDGRSSNGPGWTRSDDPKAIPPTVTANPSIAMAKYHGWLRNGKLVDA